jgi:hypothetical protein
MEELSKDLVQLYPALGDPLRTGGGWKMWFSHSIHAQAASGFLEDRLKNKRKALSKKKPKNNELDLASYSLAWESENEEGMYVNT